MSAAEDMTYNIEDLLSAIDKRWRENIDLKDLDEKLLLAENKQAIIGVASDADPTFLLDLALNKGLKQICQFSNLNLERELNTSASMLLTPNSFLKYPLSTILDPLHAGVQKESELCVFEMKFSQGSEKQNLLTQLESTLRNYIRAESLIDEIRSVADELFTNAVFNAPFIDLKSGKSIEKDRTVSSTHMPKGVYGRVFSGIYDNQLVIGCHDPFGTLKVNKLLERILTCYQNGVANSMKMGSSGGAGIGSYMVYNTAASYYVGVHSGADTVVCCSLPINMSSRKRGQIAKNMHFFEIKGGHK